MVKKHSMNPFNHDIPANREEMVNIHFNGEWVEVPKGLNVVEVAKSFGEFIPHYCYHPKLSISGNCRMCLFEMGMPKRDPERKPIIDKNGKPELMWIPKPQIGCATPVTEGMGVRTDSPLAKECRKAIMEFLLINHPLDCPICDQAGECKLQEYSTEYGSGESRFVEDKVKKPKNVDLGERIVLDDERCVLCTRCVRFANEVVNDDILGIVNRGSYNAIAAHEGQRFDNPYSLNTVDICPVGALTSKDFRFKMRVWFLKETKSVCSGCGTGCNITVGSRQDTVYRFTPRSNDAVNSHWMCDKGRLGFHYLQDEKRITEPHMGKGKLRFITTWEQIYLEIGKQIKKFKGEEIAIIASARMTNEELFLLKTWADELSVVFMDVISRPQEGDNFLRSQDCNSNTLGATMTGVSNRGKNLKKILKGVRDGSIKCMIAWQEDLTEAGFVSQDLEKLDFLITASILKNTTSDLASFVLPVAGFVEKRGTMINVHSRLQRLNKAVAVPGKGKEDWEVLCRLREVTGCGNGVHSFDDLFQSMVKNLKPLKGLNWGKITDLGLDIKIY